MAYNREDSIEIVYNRVRQDGEKLQARFAITMGDLMDYPHGPATRLCRSIDACIEAINASEKSMYHADGSILDHAVIVNLQEDKAD